MNVNGTPQSKIQRLEERAEALYPPAAWLTYAAAACLGIGVIAAIVGLWFAPGRTWGSLLVNFLFWTGLTQSSVVVAAVFNVTYARWGRAVQRIAVGLGTFLPFSLLVLVLLWFGRVHLFAWLDEERRSPWLRADWLFVRDGVVLIITTTLSLWFLYQSIRPDMGVISQQRSRRSFDALITRGWRGEREERVRSLRAMRALAPAIVIAYGFGYSILAIDLAMTLDPHFRSTMFPGIHFISEFYAALAVTTILVAAWRRIDKLAEIITPSQLLDLGNLTWGFAIFWAYLYWTQYIVIWMGNLPEEAAYHALRWRTLPWSALAWTALMCGIVVPFLFLFSGRLKRHATTLACVGAVGALGVLLQRFLDVLPSLPTLGASDYGIIETATTIGFAGGVALPYLWLMRRVPLFPVEDPLFIESLEVRDVEV